MIKLEYQYDKNEPKVVMTIANADITLDDLLVHLRAFLKACTYEFDGELILDEREKKDN